MFRSSYGSDESIRIQGQLKDYLRFYNTPKTSSRIDSESMPQSKKSLGKLDSLHPNTNSSRRSSSRSTSRSSSTAKSSDANRKTSTGDGKKGTERMIDIDFLKGRKPISAVTMNLNGKNSVIGNIPQYKINYITEFVQSEPDVIFLQDSLSDDFMKELLSKGQKKYQIKFQFIKEKKEENEDDSAPLPPLSAIAWDSDKYFGTPLELTDNRLGNLAKWVQSHNITVVKLDSKVKIGPYEDCFPSFISISWHGRDYEVPLRRRTEECTEFVNFLFTLRSNNLNIPVLVGGDFNLDLRNFEPLSEQPGLLLVPHRPGSGAGKDLKNTFLYTMDSLQIIETQTKQFHPDVFTSPWIIVKVKGRTQLKIWAIIKIQRAVRKYLKRKRTRKAGKKKMDATKELWKKKIEGEDYRPPPTPAPETKEQYNYSYSDYGDYLDSRQGTGDSSQGNGSHRRKKYEDLKSVQERKKDNQAMEDWLNM